MADTAGNPDALQQEIERTQQELARTVDSIVDRVSPKNVARRGADQIKVKTASIKGDIESATKKLPGGGQQDEDFHAELVSRDSDSNPGGAHASEQAGQSMATTVRTLVAHPTAIAVGAGVVLVVVVVAWRRRR